MSRQDKGSRLSLDEIAAQIEARIAAEESEATQARDKAERDQNEVKLERMESGDKRYWLNKSNLRGKVTGYITLYDIPEKDK